MNEKELDKLIRNAALVGFNYAKVRPEDSDKQFLKWWDDQSTKKKPKVKTTRRTKSR